MKVIVSEIPESGLELKYEEKIQAADSSFSSPFLVELRIEKITSEVIIKGNVKVDMSLQCGRCAKDFSLGLSVPIDVVYRPAEDLKEETCYLRNEELDVGFYSKDEIDLDELVREQALLCLPMKPLCSADCKGICLRCGKDLNEGTCGCGDSDVDIRLEPLKRLLSK